MSKKLNYSSESKENLENIFENENLFQLDFPHHLIAQLFFSSNKEEDNFNKNNINIKQQETTDDKKIFKVIYPEKSSLFIKGNFFEKDSQSTEFNFKKRTKSKKRLKRYKCIDNIRKMIKRRFFNTYLRNALNKKLKSAGYNLFFEYFPQCIAGNVNKKIEKDLLNLKLRQFFENKELYNQQSLTNYNHNLKVLEQLKQYENQDIENILDKTYVELFKEYLNSNEFQVEEIKRLKNMTNKQEKDNYYIEKYKYLAKHFVEFCQKK